MRGSKEDAADTARASRHLLLSFRGGTVLREASGAPPILEAPPARLSLAGAPEAVLSLARTLLSRKATLPELLRGGSPADNPYAAMQRSQALRAWDDSGLLCRTVPLPEGELAGIVPVSRHYVFRDAPPEPGARYVLSRFAYCRRVGRETWLESPLAYARIVLHDWRAQTVLHALSSGATLEDLCRGCDHTPERSLSLFLNLLLGADMLAAPGEDGEAEEEPPALRQWAFHDLLFHSRSRLGRHAEPYGKTEPFRGSIPPCPALKPAMSEGVVPLEVPDLEDIARRDVSLAAAMEARRSVRSFGGGAMTLDQLSEFLYRTARSEAAEAASSRSYEHDERPYPSGGACYELELYVAARSCDGLRPGLYHYQPREHALYELRGLDAPVRDLLADSHRATGAEDADASTAAQVLIILAARFQRVAWPYESIAYSLILKHVGVLYQSMYLVAASMGLGACALGGGDAETFARATGLDYYVEGSVGEFLLGNR